MNILFLVHRYPKQSKILEKDLIEKFSNKGHNIFVVVPNERKNKEKTYLYKYNKINIIYVKTGNYSNNVSRREKAITILTRSLFLKRGIKKYLSDEKIDYVFGYTPFMANSKLIKWIKKRYNARSLLFLWDIFPQNAKDLDIIKNKLVFNFFKYKERKMYESFDKIICNCEGQIEYIKKNNLKLKKDIFLVRNSEFLEKKEIKNNKIKLKEKYGYDKKDIIGIFGGNMGIPQKLENLLFVAEGLMNYKNLKFIFIGQGTEKSKLQEMAKNRKLENISIINFIERKKYEEILEMSDIALISLNEKYTVPNFPAKVTGYCKLGKPIFASLDSCSYQFLGEFIKKNKLGRITKAGNICDMKKEYLNLVENLGQYKEAYIRKIYEKQFDIEKAYRKIIEEIKNN